MYVLPNRKLFSDSITRIFLKYRGKAPQDDEDNREELSQGKTGNKIELFGYQKIVREYLATETPYRGLLLYHGLGSGKTCSSIAVAESVLSNNKIYILLPAALDDNYRNDIKKCGNPIYAYEQHWEIRELTEDGRKHANDLGIPNEFLDSHLKYAVTIPKKEPNFLHLSAEVKKIITDQIDTMIDKRFTFIHYNGITSSNIDKILPPDELQMFDNSVIIIDEAHNLIGNVVNDSEHKKKLYDRLYHAKNAKVVCLSGTPVVNRPNEIAYLMNLLKGPIERITIATKSGAWDESLMTSFFHKEKDVDTIEFNSVKKHILLTRNPPFFESVYSEKGERIAVKYNKELPQEPDIKLWISSWKSKFTDQFAVELDEEKLFVEELECLPTKFEDFMNTFVDGLTIKNPIMFQRRIAGLISYFKGADERMLPKRLDEDQTLQKIQMSSDQFIRYLDSRWIEIQRESKSKFRSNLNESMSSYRAGSRLTCNYAIPPELRQLVDESGEVDEDNQADKPEILARLVAEPQKYLSPEGLKHYSPKMATILKEIKENVGNKKGWNSQFVYSQYEKLEGLGIFSAVLSANGFQEYRIVKTASGWIESPDMKPNVPAYAKYTGANVNERDILRKIFNKETIDQTLQESITAPLCIFMGSSAAAEGINLRCVRNVYIMEPHWNPARIEQVIGRAMRLNSHITLPVEERNVKIHLYVTVFSPEQTVTSEGPNVVSIRRNDMVLKRYEGEPRESFMSSDEYLYEISYEKGRIIKNIALLLKQSAIDCEIHRKLHGKEQPVIQCMKFDTTSRSEDLAYKPSYKNDERDELYLRNIVRKARTLQKVRIAGIPFIYDPLTKEVFDFIAFEDTQRLLRIGVKKENEIQYLFA